MNSLEKVQISFNIGKKFITAVALIAMLFGLSMQPAKSALTNKGLIHPVNHFPT